MKRITLSFLLLASFGLFSINHAFAITNVTSYWTAQQSGTPTQYGVNPISMKLCESVNVATGACTGANDFTFTKTWTGPNGDGYCDIAAAAAGQVACNFGSTEGMPSGVTYNFVWMKIKRIFKLTGSVTNGDSSYTGSVTSCTTSSSLANTGGATMSVGSESGGTPTSQDVYMPNGPGNDSYQGNASTTAGAVRGNSLDYCDAQDAEKYVNCQYLLVAELDAAGYCTNALATGEGCSSPVNYYFTFDYSGTWANGEQDKIWMGGLAAADVGVDMVYRLTTPYTTKKGINPLIKMSFDVTNTLKSQFAHYTDNDTSVSTEFCSLDAGNPTVTMTVSDN